MRNRLIVILTLAFTAPFFTRAASNAQVRTIDVQDTQTSGSFFYSDRQVAVTTVRTVVSMYRWYKVRFGDTLEGIARHTHSKWVAIWWANRERIKNPNRIVTREEIRLPLSARVTAKMTRRAFQAIPPPPRPRPVTVTAVVSTPAPSSPSPTPQPAPVSAVPVQVSGGSFQNCVIQAESGGNPGAVNDSSGAGGLYGFLPSTWQSLGYSGNPQDAPVSVQNAAFAKEYARAGSSPWSPYDGC